MTYNLILFEIDKNVCTITINRPDKMNALNIALLGELDVAINAAIDDNNVRGIIITGSGTKAFAAGADIAEFADFDTAAAMKMAKNGQMLFDKIETSPKPVIAAVNGFALGGGCELAMACHIRVASENARFSQPEVNLGIIPGYGGTQRMMRLLGRGKGIELLLTAMMIDANEAHRLGLVNHVSSAEDLIERSRSVMEKIIAKSPLVVSQIIACANAYYDKDVDGFEFEVNEFGKCFSTHDFKEGTQAFLEKRPAAFKGK